MGSTMTGPSQHPSATMANSDANTPCPGFPRSVKRYFSSLTKGTSAGDSRRPSQVSDSGFSAASSSSVPLTYEDSEAAMARLMAVWDAEDYIKAFIDEHWSNHAAHIQPDCHITLDELHALGHLSQAEGSLACRRLLRAPAIHEEVALSLWEQLATEARNSCEPVTEDNSSEPSISIRSTSVSSRASTAESAKGLFKGLTTRRRHQEQPQPPRAHEERSTTVPACPFCSHNCLSSCGSSCSSAQSEQEQEQWEDGFWQREDPPRYSSHRYPQPSAARDWAQAVRLPADTGNCGSERNGTRACVWGKNRDRGTSRTEKKDGQSTRCKLLRKPRETWELCRDVVSVAKGDWWYI